MISDSLFCDFKIIITTLNLTSWCKRTIWTVVQIQSSDLWVSTTLVKIYARVYFGSRRVVIKRSAACHKTYGGRAVGGLLIILFLWNGVQFSNIQMIVKFEIILIIILQTKKLLIIRLTKFILCTLKIGLQADKIVVTRQNWDGLKFYYAVKKLMHAPLTINIGCNSTVLVLRLRILIDLRGLPVRGWPYLTLKNNRKRELKRFKESC